MEMKSGVGEIARVLPTGGRYTWGEPVHTISPAERQVRMMERRRELYGDVVAAKAHVPRQRKSEVTATKIEALPDVASMKVARRELNDARRAMRRGARQYRKGYYIPRRTARWWLSAWVGSVIVAGSSSWIVCYLAMR